MAHIIDLLLSEAWPYIAGLAALIAVWFAGRSDGASREREKASQDRLKMMERINEADQKLVQMGDDDVRRELERWVRPDGPEGR